MQITRSHAAWRSVSDMTLNSLMHDIVDKVFHYSEAADAHATIDKEIPAPETAPEPETPADPRDARIAELEAQVAAGSSTQDTPTASPTVS